MVEIDLTISNLEIHWIKYLPTYLILIKYLCLLNGMISSLLTFCLVGITSFLTFKLLYFTLIVLKPLCQTFHVISSYFLPDLSYVLYQCPNLNCKHVKGLRNLNLSPNSPNLETSISYNNDN